ncbi:uncharacterized protein LAESUDRAFT_732775 [Laetiporus sulphureus 93-53]|uniref:Uncharacterized protein n=1 Tax=Laetiporus sulphureus 93-53 TaxID=1314785 RepID=A0A165AZ99_9APHY|nr:uncharacterized protein LAESUDRAFT_732775 [Laetiporus sulphureus 93-53]KZS99934.1 hypothetical protein LAESUDRAFT_732775 [Laetiporus sulphureus 93-53]
MLLYTCASRDQYNVLLILDHRIHVSLAFSRVSALRLLSYVLTRTMDSICKTWVRVMRPLYP